MNMDEQERKEKLSEKFLRYYQCENTGVLATRISSEIHYGIQALERRVETLQHNVEAITDMYNVSVEECRTAREFLKMANKDREWLVEIARKCSEEIKELKSEIEELKSMTTQ